MDVYVCVEYRLFAVWFCLEQEAGFDGWSIGSFCHLRIVQSVVSFSSERGVFRVGGELEMENPKWIWSGLQIALSGKGKSLSLSYHLFQCVAAQHSLRGIHYYFTRWLFCMISFCANDIRVMEGVSVLLFLIIVRFCVIQIVQPFLWDKDYIYPKWLEKDLLTLLLYKNIQAKLSNFEWI